MKELNTMQMCIITGGDGCGDLSDIGAILGILGFGLSMAALIVTSGGLAAVLLISQASAFGGASAASAIASLAFC